VAYVERNTLSKFNNLSALPIKVVIMYVSHIKIVNSSNPRIYAFRTILSIKKLFLPQTRLTRWSY